MYGSIDTVVVSLNCALRGTPITANDISIVALFDYNKSVTANDRTVDSYSLVSDHAGAGIIRIKEIARSVAAETDGSRAESVGATATRS